VVENEDVAVIIIVETLLLMDKEVAATKDIVAKGPPEILIMTEMCDNVGGTIPFVVHTEDILGDNVTTIQEDKTFVLQEVPVLMAIVADKTTIVDETATEDAMIIVLHINQLQQPDEAILITNKNNNNPV
jgi:hypothetical protein